MTFHECHEHVVTQGSRSIWLESLVWPLVRAERRGRPCSVEPWPPPRSRTPQLCCTRRNALGQVPVPFASSTCRTVLRRQSSSAVARRPPSEHEKSCDPAYSTMPCKSPPCERYLRARNRQPDFPWRLRSPVCLRAVSLASTTGGWGPKEILRPHPHVPTTCEAIRHHPQRPHLAPQRGALGILAKTGPRSRQWMSTRDGKY